MEQDDSHRFLEAWVNGYGSIKCQICAFPGSRQEPGLPGGSAASLAAPASLPELRPSPGAVAAAASWGPVSIPTRALPAPLVCSPVCGPVSAALPCPLSPPCQCPPCPEREGRERPGLPCPQLRGCSAPGALPSHPRPSRGHLRESLDELGAGGDPALPPEEQRARINWLTDFCHI